MITSAAGFRGNTQAISLLARYIEQGRLAGTLLLSGQRGLGKTTLASILARALVCTGGADLGAEQRSMLGPLFFCGHCYSCRSIASGEQPEYVVIRPRGKQISAEQLDEEHDGLRSALMLPVMLTHRVFVIDDAHYLNETTGNQLLKIFEEAPERTLFVLTSDKPELLLPTINSRSQKISLHPIALPELMRYIEEDAQVSAAEAAEAASMSGGRYVYAMALARAPGWRASVRELGGRIFESRGIERLAGALAEFEYSALWDKLLSDSGLSEDEAIKKLASPKTDSDRGFRTRRNEIERQALLTAYDRAALWAIGEGRLPPPRFLDALTAMKARINQNVDNTLAQAAFEVEVAG